MTDYLNFVLLGLGNGAVFAALATALVGPYRSSGVVTSPPGRLPFMPRTRSRSSDAASCSTRCRGCRARWTSAGLCDLAVAMVIAMLIEGLVAVARASASSAPCGGDAAADAVASSTSRRC